jgi:hypothetical protein
VAEDQLLRRGIVGEGGMVKFIDFGSGERWFKVMGGLLCLRLRSILMEHLKWIMRWILEFLIKGWEGGHGGQVHWAGQVQDNLLNITPQSQPDLSSNYPNPHLSQQARPSYGQNVEVLVFR